MKQGGFTGEMTKEKRLSILNKLERCDVGGVAYKDFCPKSGSGHYWIDVTTVNDTKQVEVCKNCNEVLLSKFSF